MAQAAKEHQPWRPAICVVGFHHARGPEIESWYGVPEGTDPAVDNDWSFLPFMALSDGAHAATEDFSYFTLRRKASPEAGPATSLFGMSCTRQLDARDLINRPDDVTRSTVQKSVVVLARSPHVFTAWREKLSLVTRAWFMQREFTITTILKEFQENLEESERNTTDDERDQFVGVSLREFVHEFKHQALVLFKCCLLQPKMLFFGSRCLIRKLEDCADPELDSYGKGVIAPTSLKTSDRASLLAYVGLPIQIFGKGSLFGPYTPLQQLDVLADFGTKSYIVGSTNSLLLQQKDRYSDILINLDDSTITVTSASLKAALALTAADRRWIDLIYQDILLTWDPANPSRPRDLGFKGSEDYIRILFEQYVIALLSATKFHLYLAKVPAHKRSLAAFPDIDGDPALDFGENWLESWKTTTSFALWSRLTDPHLFDLVDPRHPTAGGFTAEDFNRRFAQQFHDLQLDERFSTSREALGKTLASTNKKVSAAINTIWADFEARRAAAAHRAKSQIREEGKEGDDPSSLASNRHSHHLSPSSASGAYSPAPASPAGSAYFDANAIRARAPDLSVAQAAVGAAGQKAGAYFSSWGSWASERRKGWAKGGGGENSASPSPSRPWSGAVDVSPTRMSGAAAPAPGGQPRQHLAEKAGGDNAAGGEKRASLMFREADGGLEARSPKSPKSPRKGVRRGVSKEEIVGSDGIGRLDA